jgi:hypothetical protein
MIVIINSIIAYNVASEEFSGVLYLSELADERSFCDLLNSPWIYTLRSSSDLLRSLGKRFPSSNSFSPASGMWAAI